MNTGPEISVIIPTFNRGQTLRRSINSVLSQSYSAFELIIVDDASTDNTLALLRELDDPRIRVIQHEKNKGFAGALNTGVRASKAELIAFQDSDDEWLDAKLTKQMRALRSAPKDCVCVYCVKIVYGRDANYERGKRRIVCVPGPDEKNMHGDLKNVLQQRNLVSTQTILCKREAYLSAGGFDERLHNSVDWDFTSRLSEIGTFAFVDEPLVNTYIQTDSISTLSTKAPYSQLIIMNKMKRRGAAPNIQAERWADIGYKIGKLGRPGRGETLLRASLVAQPLVPKTWGRLIANRVRAFQSRMNLSVPAAQR